MPGMPAGDTRTGDRRLLMNLPIWVAGGIGAAVTLVRSALVFVENLRSEPGEWESLASLAVILLATSVFVVLACAAGGVAIGCVLRAVFTARRRRQWSGGAV